MQFNQGNHNHNENTEYHYYGDYVQREETHVHMHGEAMDKAGSVIYDISALHGIRKLLFVIVFAAANCIRLCSFGFFAILHLAAVIIQKFVALYLVLMGIMLISGLMGDAIPWISVIVLTITLGILYLLCNDTEAWYGYFVQLINRTLDALYRRLV